jgi:hypothetical protein
MPCVRFEPTIPVAERTKTVHVLDSSATVTGKTDYLNVKAGSTYSIICALMANFDLYQFTRLHLHLNKMHQISHKWFIE